MPDIEGTVTKPEGTKIELYAYPCASDIHLTVVHAGETIVDKDIAQMEAWVDDDKIGDDRVRFLVASVELVNGEPQQKLVASGDKLEKGEMIAASVVNDADFTAVLTQYDGNGKETGKVEIAAGEANGFMHMEWSEDVRFVLTRSEEPAKPTEEPTQSPAASPTGTTSPTQSPTASPTETTTATPSATVTVTPAGSAGRTSGTAASQTAASATSSSAGSVRTADESHAPFYLFSSVLAALAAVMLLRARRSIG